MAKSIMSPCAWANVDMASGLLRNAEVAMGMMSEAAAFTYADAADSGRAQERIIILLQSIRSYVQESRSILDDVVTHLQLEGV